MTQDTPAMETRAPLPSLKERMRLRPVDVWFTTLNLALLLLVATVIGPLITPRETEVGVRVAFTESFKTAVNLIICMAAIHAAFWAGRAVPFLYRRPYLRGSVMGGATFLLVAFVLHTVGLL